MSNATDESPIKPSTQGQVDPQIPPLLPTLSGWRPRRWWRRVPFVSLQPRPIVSALDPNHPDAKLTPEAGAGWLSRACFSWVSPILAAGYTRPLENDDLYLLQQHRQARSLGSRLVRALEQRLAQRTLTETGGMRPRIPPLMWAMNDVVLRYFWLGGLMKLLADVGTITSPLLVRALVDFVYDSYQARTDPARAPPIGKGVALAVGLFGVQVACALLNAHAFQRGFDTGILLRAALIQAVFERSMNLSSRARSEGGWSVGKLVTLISADATRIDYCGQFFHMAWTSAVQVAICIGLLVGALGYSALPGFAMLLLLSPAQAAITRRLFTLRKRSMFWTDRRNAAIDEVVGSVRIVKQYAWEAPYAKRIQQLRAKEMAFHRQRLYLRSLNLALAFATPTLATVLSFVTYALSGHRLDAGVLFSSLALFALLRTPLQFLPIAWNAIVDARNATERIGTVLEAEVRRDCIVRDPEAKDAISMQKASFTWEAADTTQSQPVKEPLARSNGKGEVEATSQAEDVAKKELVASLEEINLVVHRGSLCAVVGGVGSGKSALISALAGEMRQTQGAVTLSSAVAVCEQVAWIQSTTIRDNIIFGNTFDPQRYRNVLESCCLLPDLAKLPEGDHTVVGEKGVSLSGGQKQRINIARAVYHDSGIFLLDDCLSSLDARVAADVFASIIAGPAMRDKTRLLVTHSTRFLEACDWIVCMERGRIVEQGSYAQLCVGKSRVAELLRSRSADRARDDAEVEQDRVGGRNEVGSDEDGISAATLGREPGTVDDQDESSSSAITACTAPPPEQDTGKRGERRHQSKALMQREERYSGSVSRKIYMAYLASAPLKLFAPLFATAVVVFQGSTVMSPVWLLWWQNGYWKLPRGLYMGIYAVLGLAQSLGLLGMGIVFSGFTIHAATNLHHRALQRVLHAPFSFFDATPQGRITHRFSRDMDTLDNVIGEAMRTLVGTVVQVVGSIVLIAVLTPYFLVAVAAILLLYYWIAAFYRSTARELRRIDAGLRSSMHEHFSESLHGVTTVRAYARVDAFVRQNAHRIDQQNRAYWLVQACQRWLSLRLDILGSLLVFSVAVVAVVTRFRIGPGEMGVALSYMLTAQGVFGWMVRHAAELENNMSAVERVLHYADRIEQEKPYRVPEVDDELVVQGWPRRGAIRFEGVEIRYPTSDRPVLCGLDLDIQPGERMAFCGRTGAGKSTLVTALLRTVELCRGRILIDGVDIATVGLQLLRSRISLIPQDAVIFCGTLRHNLDPLGEHTDAALWDALRRTRLANLSLDADVAEGGGNLSAGQRSLVSLARALVRRTKIVILDEATASIDEETDRQIQEVLATEFAGCTTLTVAHRIRTILDADRVCVLKAGRIVEMGPPLQLYACVDGAFRALCQSAKVRYENGRWQ
ncbi:Multidrug resistance protein fer6 [Thecaphora frezii]